MKPEPLGHKFIYLISLIAAMWAIHLLTFIGVDRLYQFGLVPRKFSGLDGIIASPFLHADFKHLVSNTLGLTSLGGLLSMHGAKTFVRVTLFVVLLGGLATWLFAQSAIHIGASGLIFGFFGFLVARGFIEKSLGSLLLSGLVAIMYGGILWGVLPLQSGVSWEGHLFGFLAGIGAARWQVYS